MHKNIYICIQRAQRNLILKLFAVIVKYSTNIVIDGDINSVVDEHL